jgi:prolyl oligopeptidase
MTCARCCTASSSSTAPLRRGNRYFVSRRRATDDLYIHYVRGGADSPDTVLLDPHALSPDHTVDVTLDDISQDGRVLVYGLRRGGEDETELHVRDVAKRTNLSDTLSRGLYRGVSLKPDGSGFYYSAQNRQTGIRVRYHRRRGHARAAAAGAQDDGAGAGGHDLGPAGPPSL